MRLYHVTTPEHARSILSEGFRDCTDAYLTDREWSGVWLSDKPLDGNEGAAGTVVLSVDLNLNESALAEWEWAEDGKPYREWLIPAATVNRFGTVDIVQAGDGASLPGRQPGL